MAQQCIQRGIINTDIMQTLDHAERYIFQDELIVPYDSLEQKKLLIKAISTVIPNFDELTRLKYKN